MKNKIDVYLPETGKRKNNIKLGYSWTTLFFGFLVPLFRGDWITFLLLLLVDAALASVSFGFGFTVANFIWAFFYNKVYARRLHKDGYVGVTENDHMSLVDYIK